MNLSSIAVEQREKGAKKLNSFLAIGLISSLALHIGVLSLGISNFTKKTAEVKDEPLEIEIVDLPDPQKPEIKQSPKLQASNSNRVFSSASSEGGSIALSNNTPARELQRSSAPSKPIKVALSRSAIAPQKSPISVAPAKVKTPPISQQKPIQTSKTTVTQPVPVAKVIAPSEIATRSKPVVTPLPLEAASPKPAPNQKASVPSPISSQPENTQLRKLLASTRTTQQLNNTSTASKPSNLSDRQTSLANNSLQSGKGTIDGAASSSRTSKGSNPSNGLSNFTGSNSSSASRISTANNLSGGSNNGTGNGSRISTANNPSGNLNSGRGNGYSIGANRESSSNVARTQNRPRNSQPEFHSNANSSSGGLACRSCSKPKYPDKARRRGWEGKAEISVDVDGKGNVTDVRLARSSGHSELDEAALQQARRWKFKAPNKGAQGVSAKVDFAIEGSERSRKLKERRKRRQTQQRLIPTMQTTDAPLPTQRTIDNPSPQNASSPRRQTRSRQRIDTLPPRRPKERQRPPTQQASSQNRLRQSLRRQQPTSNRATPSSQTKLRQSLRQLRPNPQPVASPND